MGSDFLLLLLSLGSLQSEVSGGVASSWLVTSLSSSENPGTLTMLTGVRLGKGEGIPGFGEKT